MPKILDLKDAVTCLTKELGRGYSRSSILRRIESGEWVQGKHWQNHAPQGSKVRTLKINVSYVIQAIEKANKVRRSA